MEIFKYVTVMTTPRPCMKCQDMFPSMGPGNRLCADCNKSNLGLSRTEAHPPRRLPAGVSEPRDT